MVKRPAADSAARGGLARVDVPPRADRPSAADPAAVLIVGAAWWLNNGGQVPRFLAPVLGTLASIGIALDGESMPPLVRAGVLIVVAGCAIYLWWLVIRD